MTADQESAPADPPAARYLPVGALDSAVTGAGRLDAWARTGHGRDVLAHALVQLAKDGWLREIPGEVPGDETVTRIMEGGDDDD